MRQHFTIDWAVGIRGAIENLVRANFPSELRSWPLLQTFDFEAYELEETFLVMILKEKLSGIPAGPGIPDAFPYTGYPKLPPLPNELELWQFYLRNKFSLREEDAPFIIPVHDSGKNNAAEDYKLFSTEEQYFWNQQITYVVSRYKAHLDAMTSRPPSQPQNNYYNVSGYNTRVNINSNDSSVNIVNTERNKVFAQLREVLPQITNESERQAIASNIQSMEATQGTNDFITHYQHFMSFASNHMTVFAPFLAALAGLLAS